MKEKVSDQAEVIALLDFVRDGGDLPKRERAGMLASVTSQVLARKKTDKKDVSAVDETPDLAAFKDCLI